MNNEQWQISGIFPTKVSKLLHSVLDWELCFHCRQVQPRHLPAKTGLPGKLNILLTKKMGWFSDLNQTMTGLATSTTTIGACSDYLTVAGHFGGFSVSFSICCQLFHTLVEPRFLSAFPHVARSDWHRPASYLWHQQRLSQWVKTYFSTFSILCSVRRVWWELNWHDQSDFHLRLDHFGKDLECSAAPDCLHCFIQVGGMFMSQITWMANNAKLARITCSGLPLIVSNTSRAPLERSTLTTLARCWAGCPTPTASALRC